MTDPIVLAFGTALVGAIATSTWQGVRNAVAGIWHRVIPQQADGIEAELDELREQVMQARDHGDRTTETALEGAWQVKLQRLLRAEPGLAPELLRAVEEVLIPALAPAEKTRIGAIMMSGSSHDSSTFIQIGFQAHRGEP